MATPTQNSISTTFYNISTTANWRYLAAGSKWGGAFGTGVTLTYSFPTGTAYFQSPYSEFNTWNTTTAAEQTSIREGLAAWSAVANIRFIQVADNQSTVGELRFAKSDMIDFAHAYFPDDTPKAGVATSGSETPVGGLAGILMAVTHPRGAMISTRSCTRSAMLWA